MLEFQNHCKKLSSSYVQQKYFSFTEFVTQHLKKHQNSSAVVSLLPSAPALPYNKAVTSVTKKLGLTFSLLNSRFFASEVH